MSKPLFVPLRKEWFQKFASGEKRSEYRVNGPRWNKRVCKEGRAAVLANGYGWPRLHARILRTVIIPAHRAPKAARQIFGARELIRIDVENVRPIERAAWELFNRLGQRRNTVMTRDEALPYVSFAVDDALAPRDPKDAPSDARLVGWQCGFEPMFVAVWSYLGHALDDEEATEIATDLLVERHWFSDGATEPDYVI